MNKGLLAIYTLFFISLLLSANSHGKPKKGNDNFWLSLIGQAVMLTLIWWALDWKMF